MPSANFCSLGLNGFGINQIMFLPWFVNFVTTTAISIVFVITTFAIAFNVKFTNSSLNKKFDF